jgi:hypothetical protein
MASSRHGAATMQGRGHCGIRAGKGLAERCQAVGASCLGLFTRNETGTSSSSSDGIAASTSLGSAFLGSSHSSTCEGALQVGLVQAGQIAHHLPSACSTQCASITGCAQPQVCRQVTKMAAAASPPRCRSLIVAAVSMP